MILSVSKTGEKRFHEPELLLFTRNGMDTSYEYIRILFILSLLNKLMFEEKDYIYIIMKIVGLKKIYWLDFYQLESFLKVIFYKLDSY